MARTTAGAQLTQQHRLDQLSIRAALLRDLLALWRAVNAPDLSSAMPQFSVAAATLIRAGFAGSATLAARYFERFREVEGARGPVAVVAPDPPMSDAVAGLVRGAGLAGILHARRAGLSPQVAAQSGFVRVSGTASGIALDGGRQVVTAAAEGDRAATGKWQRVASADACAFCAMLAMRGPVFKPGGGVSPTGSGITFAAHDNCSCVAEPAYEGSVLPEASQRFREQWEQAKREVLPDVEGTSNDALNAFRRLREGRA